MSNNHHSLTCCCAGICYLHFSY